MPNAGYPLLEGNRTVYTNDPDYFARRLLKFREIGRRYSAAAAARRRSTSGGPRSCCVLAGVNKRFMPCILPSKGGEAARPQPFLGEDEAWRKGRRGGGGPAQDASAEKMLNGAERLSHAGADILTVSDNPLASVRADSSMTATLIARRCGCEVMPHIACRDRNLNAIKSLLLALHIEGVRNVLVVTGDPIAQADRSEVKGVYNSNSSMLAGYMRSLNESAFAGEPFAIGAALNVNAGNFDAELRRAEKKIARGAQFFLTQPVFGEKAVEAVRIASDHLGSKILAGILPIASFRNALFMNNEAPGISIPEEIVEKFRELKRAEAEKLGVEIALETARLLAHHADGYYILTPLKRYGMVSELVKRIRRELID